MFIQCTFTLHKGNPCFVSYLFAILTVDKKRRKSLRFLIYVLQTAAVSFSLHSFPLGDQTISLLVSEQNITLSYLEASATEEQFGSSKSPVVLMLTLHSQICASIRSTGFFVVAFEIEKCVKLFSEFKHQTESLVNFDFVQKVQTGSDFPFWD